MAAKVSFLGSRIIQRLSSSIKPLGVVTMTAEPPTATNAATAAATKPSRWNDEAQTTNILYYISSGRFKALWWIFFTIHFIVGLQLLLLGGFYFMLMGYPSVGYYLAMFQLTSLESFPLVIAVYLITAVFIYRDVYLMIKHSIKHRRLCMINESRFASIAKHPRQPTTLPQQLWALYLKIFSVRSKYFDIVMLTRELVEVTVQISQAYQSSCYTPNVWLNFCFGALIAVNCISSPIAARVTGTDVGQLRMYILLIDLVLDIVWLALPLILFPHYIQGFFGGNAIMYEDTFMVRAFMETQLMMVTSQIDLFMKVLPSLSIFFTVRKLRSLLRRPSKDLDPLTTTGATATTRLVVPVSAVVVQPLASDGNNTVTSTPIPAARAQRHPKHTAFLSRESQLMHGANYILIRVLVVLGAFTIVMYALVAALRGECEPGCKLVVYPWFEYSRCRCVVQEISCHERGIVGSTHEMQQAFDQLERPGLQSLIVSHCPQLHVPPEIRSFVDLYGLEIYNSTIASWPANASLSAAAFARLGFVYLVRTHTDTIPDGLLQGDLPASLLEIDIIVSRLSTLPPDLHTMWPGVKNIYLDHGQFTEVPPVLGRMRRLESIAFYNNSIHTIATDTFTNSSLSYLLLNGNPLTQLPVSLGNTDTLYEVQIQDTNIDAPLPATWASGAKPSMELRIFGRGSPICTGQDDANTITAATGAYNPTVFSGGFAVSCEIRGSQYNDIRSKAYFALEGKTVDRNIH